ncbi:Na+/H+ antiporter subunit C [Phragmitibacter flavus]|uniref:Na+/H+ antiporter subunit C n=1 Tax=Phragmitibacter flavus TaxID=2576071 RepID=A0A5R8KA38_9BACT|nr:Na+/H+ antiporter subunit C [Phragmitibacter flavus]TLD69161.1 Na+/H+ antiporter subunit C [Phragmitibacter flavus]
METILAIVIGGIYAMSFYLMLRRSLVKLILGIMLFGQGVNLLIFTSSGLTRSAAPVIPGNADQLTAPYADPLPQALILTAIVIGFGILAFSLALMHRAHQTLKTDDLDNMRGSDQ